MKRRADLLGAPAYPGSSPQATSDREQEAAGYSMPEAEGPRPDYTVAEPKDPDIYNWSMSGTHVAVSDDHHGDQFSAMGWTDFGRPHAYGKVELHYRWATYWHVLYTNMAMHIVEKRLKRYTKEQGWDWGGILDDEGMPMQSASLKQAAVPGIGEINPGVKDWKNNEWAGTEMFDNPAENQSDTPYYGFQDYDEDFPMSSPRTCSECGELLLNYDDWRKHVLRNHVNPDRKPPGEPQPVVDLDDVLPAGFNEAVMDTTVQRQSRLIYQFTAENPPNMIRKAMADRTGNPDVDALIQEFLQTPQGDWTTDNTPIESLRDPATAHGMCEMVTEQFVEFAKEHGFKAYVTQTDIDEMGYKPSIEPFGEVGFDENDEMQYGFYPEHTIATIILDDPAYPYGREFYIDFTATQYGYTDHPKVTSSNTYTAARPRQQLIQGPMPFIYDIESDRIFVGHPGERHSDIQGRFTPGGLIEGLYDPQGNVQIRTDTDMPYTVRHLIELWYSLHPELAVKSIFLMVGEDQKYKLASSNIGHKVRNLVAVDPAAWSVVQALEPLGNVYAVGGAVRDIILGKAPKDIDLMVQGVEAEEVEHALKRLPGRVDYHGESFGVFRYRDPEGNEVEVALPRTERSTGGGHRDFEVYTSPYISVGEDLARRDFTGNAMAVNLSTGDLVDPYHGSEDLKAGILRPVSDRSFVEDPLRILRAFSSVARHGLDPSPDAYHDLAAHAGLLSELPRERLQMEVDKMMSGSDPAKAVDLMEATGVLQHVLPEVAATSGFDQKNPHHEHLLSEHLKEVLRRIAQETDDVDLRWAALLHDIGKPSSQWIDEAGVGHYYKNELGQGDDHERVGAELAQKLLTELKFPTDRIARITHLIQQHMFPTFSSQQGARKFINRVGDEHADDLLRLRTADLGGKGLGHENTPIMQQYVQRVREAGEPTDTSMLAINGNDLIAAGYQPGPAMGQLLRYLTELVIEDPTLNNPETLLQIARDGQSDVKFSSNLTGQSDIKVGNILDPIKDSLDPDVFNNAESVDPTVKPKIVEWVKRKVYKTMIDAGWPDPSKYLSLILTGSLTTYQWSELSDFDTSLWVDVERFPEWVRADLIALMIEKCDGIIVPGTTHPVQCFVVDSTRYTPQDLYQPGLRSGYDLDEGQWLVLPERGRSIDVAERWPEVLRYARDCVNKLKMMIRYDKYAVKTYYDFLHKRRFLDMRAGKGDYAESNIIYKLIANEGLHPIIEEITGEHIA